MAKVYVIEPGGKRTATDLGDELARGGEGAVHRVPAFAACAAKIYHQANGASHFNRSKIEAMIESPPANMLASARTERLPIFAWPTHLVEDKSGKGIGFLMPEIPMDRAVTLTKYMSTILMERSLSKDDRSLVRRVELCRNLAAAMAELHRQKHFFVDLKPQNILMFKDTGIVCLIDTDSFAIASQSGAYFSATAYSSEYMSPELLKGTLKPESVTNDWQDRFALSVLIFQILNNGLHPYQGTPLIQTEDWNIDYCVRNGYYPYGLSANSGARPAEYSVHHCLDDGTRSMFDRAFTATRPSTRPSAQEWRDHLSSLSQTKGSFVRCDKKPDEVTHIHFAGKSCPQCGSEAIDLATPRKSRSSVRNFGGSTSSSSLPVSGGSLPPPDPGNRKWAYILLVGIIGLCVIAAIANGATRSSGNSDLSSTGGSSPVAELPRPSPSSNDTLASLPAPPPPTYSPPESASAPQPLADESTPNTQQEASKPAITLASLQLSARGTTNPVDTDGLEARGRIILDHVLQASIDANLSDILEIIAFGIAGNDSLTLDAAIRKVRNTDPLNNFDGWERFRKDARKVNEATLATYRTDPTEAARLQWQALTLDPLDKEIAGNMGIYMALAGQNGPARTFAIYALGLPRKDDQPGRIADWNLLGATLAKDGKTDAAKGAYFVALAITSNLSGYCKGLLAQQALLGESLKPAIEAVFKRIDDRGQSPTDNCAYPPHWVD